MQRSRKNPRAPRVDTWPFQFAYDLGRTARHVKETWWDTWGAVNDAWVWVRGTSVPNTEGKNSNVRRVKLRRRQKRNGERRSRRSTSLVFGHVEPRSESTEALDRLTRSARAFVVGVANDPTKVERLRFADARWDVRLSDLEAIADASGLTASFVEMRRIALRHSTDPVVLKLIQRLDDLNDEQRQELAERLLQRPLQDPVVQRLLATGGYAPALLAREDLERLARLTTLAVNDLLQQLGLSSAEVLRLTLILHEVSQPLSKLTELYVNPRGLRDKLRRYWRLQKVGFRVLKIMSRSGFMEGPGAIGPGSLGAHPRGVDASSGHAGEQQRSDIADERPVIDVEGHSDPPEPVADHPAVGTSYVTQLKGRKEG